MRKNPKEIIRSFKNTGSIQVTAKEVGVHKVTVYRWLKRSKSVLARLKITEKYAVRKSTEPKEIHYALSTTERIRIRELREKKQWDVRKIKALD